MFIENIATTNGSNWDLMFIVVSGDSSYYMTQELETTLPQIFQLTKLTDFFVNISILSYHEYCDKETRLEWSGWKDKKGFKLLKSFMNEIKMEDRVLSDMQTTKYSNYFEAFTKIENNTICIMLYEEPSHQKFKYTKNHEESFQSNIEELEYWLFANEKINKNNVRFFPLYIQTEKSKDTKLPFFATLSELASGKCFNIQKSQVVKTTIGILLNLAGLKYNYHSSTQIVSMFIKHNEKSSLSDPYLFSKLKIIYSSDIDIPKVEKFKYKIEDMLHKIRNDMKFTDLVYMIFSQIVTKKNVISLTYNILFTEIWNLLCEQHNDSRLKKIVNKIRKLKESVSHNDAIILHGLINMSFIRHKISKNIYKKYETPQKFYVFDRRTCENHKKNFEIENICSLSSINAISNIIATLKIYDKNPQKAYIPTNMSLEDIFVILSFQICPEIHYDSRLRYIMAVICIISNSLLSLQAKEFLNNSRGSWINFSLPENNTLDFSLLMIKVVTYALNEYEEEVLIALQMEKSIIKYKDVKLEVNVSYSSNVDKRLSYKKRCVKCNQWRSNTMFTGSHCVLCQSGMTFFDNNRVYNYMCECKTCLVHYSIYNYKNLEYKSKCHFCRLGQTAPYIECKMCLNKFLFQHSNVPITYICPICKIDPNSFMQVYEITLENYIKINGALFIGVDIKDPHKFFNSKKKHDKKTPEERLKMMRYFQEISKNDLENHKFPIGNSFKKVLNVDKLQLQIFKVFEYIQTERCGICFKIFNFNDLEPVCGDNTKRCSTNACKTCLKTYYGQIKLNAFFFVSTMFCPFCKSVPNPLILRRYNIELYKICSTIDYKNLDSDFSYRLCKKCNKIQKYMKPEYLNIYIYSDDYICMTCNNVVEKIATIRFPRINALAEYIRRLF